MKIDKMTDEEVRTCLRVPLAQGSIGDDNFVMSILVTNDNARGVIIEFDKTAYIIKTEELAKEVARELYKKTDIFSTGPAREEDFEERD